MITRPIFTRPRREGERDMRPLVFMHGVFQQAPNGHGLRCPEGERERLSLEALWGEGKEVVLDHA